MLKHLAPRPSTSSPSPAARCRALDSKSAGVITAEKAMALAGELELMGQGNNLSGAGKVFESLVQTLDDLRSQLNGTMQAHRVGEADKTTGS